MKHMKYVLIPMMIFGLAACQTGEKEEATKKLPDKDKPETIKISVTSAGVPESVYYFDDLPYAADSLEPHIDAEIMRLHYGKHHKGYYKKFLNAIEGTSAEGESLAKIFSEIDNYDADVRNNAGGYYNHWVFWDNMTPDDTEPSADLKAEIEETYDSMDAFFEAFSTAAKGHFGSGWAWLIMDDSGELLITSTPNQDNPLMSISDNQGYPLLAIDVWEHAYYLQYKNERGSYIDAFMDVIDWNEVSRRYELALEGKHYVPGE